MTSYNHMGMVDPQGRFHSTDGLSHPDWAHRNGHLVGFKGTKDGDYELASGDDAIFDRDGRTALDYFKDEGWIRVKPDQGCEIGGLHSGNLGIIKTVLRSIAKENPGKTLYVDDGEGSSKRVFVDMRGRPDFSAIEGGDGRASKRWRG